MDFREPVLRPVIPGWNAVSAPAEVSAGPQPHTLSMHGQHPRQTRAAPASGLPAIASRGHEFIPCGNGGQVPSMNALHERLCKSDRWARSVRDAILPAALADVDLGDDPLELGPGPGRTTELLLDRTDRLTALEIDVAAAERLRARSDSTRLTVVEGDATAMPFPAGRFSAVVALTMLHHLPTSAAQDQLFAEVARVLRPGGWLCGSDGLLSPRFRLIHIWDTLTPIDPHLLPNRLRAAGLTEVRITRGKTRVAFQARRP
jgi:SAM-dependent methyltransferase